MSLGSSLSNVSICSFSFPFTIVDGISFGFRPFVEQNKQFEDDAMGPEKLQQAFLISFQTEIDESKTNPRFIQY